MNFDRLLSWMFTQQIQCFVIRYKRREITISSFIKLTESGQSTEIVWSIYRTNCVFCDRIKTFPREEWNETFDRGHNP